MHHLVERMASPAKLPSSGKLTGGKTRILFHRVGELFNRSVSVMMHGVSENTNRSADFYRLVNEPVVERSRTSFAKAQLSIGIKPSMANGLVTDIKNAWDAIAIVFSGRR